MWSDFIFPNAIGSVIFLRFYTWVFLSSYFYYSLMGFFGVGIGVKAIVDLCRINICIVGLLSLFLGNGFELELK